MFYCLVLSATRLFSLSLFWLTSSGFQVFGFWHCTLLHTQLSLFCNGHAGVKTLVTKDKMCLLENKENFSQSGARRSYCGRLGVLRDRKKKKKSRPKVEREVARIPSAAFPLQCEECRSYSNTSQQWNLEPPCGIWKCCSVKSCLIGKRLAVTISLASTSVTSSIHVLTRAVALYNHLLG